MDIKFPDVGEGITEGTLVKWLVKIGDDIKADQAVAEIETDKAIVEIPSSKAGKITRLNGKVGDVIKVGSILAALALPGEAAAPPVKPPEVRPEVKPEVRVPEVEIPEVRAPEKATGRVLATPSTRRLA